MFSPLTARSVRFYSSYTFPPLLVLTFHSPREFLFPSLQALSKAFFQKKLSHLKSPPSQCNPTAVFELG